MMSLQRHRHLVLTLSCLLLSSSKSTLLSRGKVRRAQEIDENSTGVSLEDIEANFQPDHDFSVSDAAASSLQLNDGVTLGSGNESLVTTEQDFGSSGLDPGRYSERPRRGSESHSPAPSSYPIQPPASTDDSTPVADTPTDDDGKGSGGRFPVSESPIASNPTDDDEIANSPTDDDGKGKGGGGKGKGGGGKGKGGDKEGKGKGVEGKKGGKKGSAKGKGKGGKKGDGKAKVGKGKGGIDPTPDATPSPSSPHIVKPPFDSPTAMLPTLSPIPTPEKSALPSTNISPRPTLAVYTLMPTQGTSTGPTIFGQSMTPSSQGTSTGPTIFGQSMMPTQGTSTGPTVFGQTMMPSSQETSTSPTAFGQTMMPSSQETSTGPTVFGESMMPSSIGPTGCGGRDCDRPTRPIRKLEQNLI